MESRCCSLSQFPMLQSTPNPNYRIHCSLIYYYCSSTSHSHRMITPSLNTLYVWLKKRFNESWYLNMWRFTTTYSQLPILIIPHTIDMSLGYIYCVTILHVIKTVWWPPHDSLVIINLYEHILGTVTFFPESFSPTPNYPYYESN